MAVKNRRNDRCPYTALDHLPVNDALTGAGKCLYDGTSHLYSGAVASVSVGNSGSQVVCAVDGCSPLYRPMTRKIEAQVCVPLSHMLRESMNNGSRDLNSEMVNYAKREIAMAIAEQLVSGGIISFDQNIEFDGGLYSEPRMVVRGELEIPS
jgi:hypothetical protein